MRSEYFDLSGRLFDATNVAANQEWSQQMRAGQKWARLGVPIVTPTLSPALVCVIGGTSTIIIKRIKMMSPPLLYSSKNTSTSWLVVTVSVSLLLSLVLLAPLDVVQAGIFASGGRNATTAPTDKVPYTNHKKRPLSPPVGSLDKQERWYNDLWNLPADVPFPGANWLDRLPKTANGGMFEFQGNSFSSVYAAILHNDPLRYPARNLNCYINSIFIPTGTAEFLVKLFSSLSLAHYFISYLRNLIAGMLVYYGTAGMFHYFCYIHPSTSTVFRQGQRPYPRRDIIFHQIRLAQSSLFLYTLLPVLDDFLIEQQNWTRVYYTIQEIGGYGWYLVSMVLYFGLVEVGIYWMHRTLHTNKFLYKYIHALHHQYKTPDTLTPWASIAFHPLDGILQASPYEFVMFLLPCHYLTHLILIFFTAVWATYIHDAMDFNIDPIMGAKYHTVHHTHYIYNYGQVFTFCDRIWGTLRIPMEPTGGLKKQTLKKID